MSLDLYIRYFSQLKRSSVYGGAPHKPVLLLSLIAGIESSKIRSNRIFISPELVSHFKEIWQVLVDTNHVSNFSLPFFHMRSEPFWRLVCYPGTELLVNKSKSINSFAALRAAVEYAEIDEALFVYLSNPDSRAILRNLLLEEYFPTKAQHWIVDLKPTIIPALEKEILHSSHKDYSEKYLQLKLQLSKEEFEEETYIRSGIFKREIPKIYNYSCAISGMRIITTTNAQMVDACHIVPFAISNDDTVGNGLSLSPTLHRAFDRGLICISNDFKVIISSSIKEDITPYSMSQFAGKTILLPQNPEYFPLRENLEWHRREKWVG